jgi:hypothetical protein
LFRAAWLQLKVDRRENARLGEQKRTYINHREDSTSTSAPGVWPTAGALVVVAGAVAAGWVEKSGALGFPSEPLRRLSMHTHPI